MFVTTKADKVQKLTDEAINMVEAHSNDNWIREARRIVLSLARTQKEFTTDEVWAQLDLLDARTHEPRSMGAVMRSASRARWTTPTDRVRKSVRPECHSRPVRVWRSLMLNIDS
jgi:hypothetical protein